MVYKDGEKMSKSLGNLVFVHELLKDHEAGAIRLAIVGNHYRSEWSWSDAMMADADARFDRWKAAGTGDAALAAVRSALDDDLDTPAAVRAIDDAAAQGMGVSRAAALLGVIVGD